MELSDKIKIDAPRERVFAALNDIEILREAIPGCETIEANGTDAYTATVTQKVGPLKARFKGDVTLSDILPPESYTLEGAGKAGPAGHVKVRARVKLEEDGKGTMLNYEVNADIGGKLAQLGGHLVERTSKKLSAQFFERLEELIEVENTPDEAPTDSNPAKDQSEDNNMALWVIGAALIVGALLWVVL